ncbi:MAG TPA: TolC family outer membrane protein [Stellaceae bacterium]|nr:TolC family outer membrane protein [Stellaceae bacterium]
MRGRHRTLAAAAGILLAAGIGPAAAETLTQALAYAYQTNPQLLAQRALLRSTDEQVPQALSNWRPTVTFTGNIGAEVNGTAAQDPIFLVPNPVTGPHSSRNQTTTLRPNLVELELSQPVYRGGRTEAQTAEAIDTVQSTRAQTLAVETAVFQSVAQAYLDCVRDQTLLEVNRNNEQVLRKQLEATQDRFRVGEVTRTDVAQAESSLAQATATRIASEGQLASSRAEYTAAVGHPPGRLLQPRERPALPATRAEALGLAANNNPNVISAIYAERAARDNVAVVRGQLLPQISLVGTVSRGYDQAATDKGLLAQSAQVEAEMTMPLYEGGAIYSQTRQAEQTVGQKRSLVDQARRSAVQSATQAWETLISDRASIASFAAAVRAAQIALEGTEQEALVGSRTVLDVLIAEQQVFTTQSQLVVSQHDTALQEYNLAADTGRLIAPELRLPVKLYDMERHYKAVKDKWLGFGGGLKE